MPATPDSYASLLGWASAGQRLARAIDGTRHFGLGLVRTWPAPVRDPASSALAGTRRPCGC
ncbi:MAG TPA: hypothetical protein VIJ82_03635 [Streptosporangiaceae bacterium]